MSTQTQSPRPEHPVPLHGEGPPNPPDESPLPVGTRIGGDVVEGVLGRGGFATVYRVRGPEGHVSALKLLPLDQGPERTARAWREVSLGTRLRHPNLARQLGGGQWPPDKPRFVWMKFELVEGSTLDEWAPGRTLGEVVERVLEVARALAVSHEAGVLHRDVKEANILVRQSTGQAVLVDFGVGYHPAYPTLTKGMFPPGTPPYRAPEAWAYGRAHAGEPGAHYRAGVGDDLYALGVVFYRLLTGRFPFRPSEHGGEDVEAVLHREPLPPHLVNPRVPLAVEAVCLRLLAKTPEARYPGAVALHKALEELKAGADASWTVPLLPERRPAVRPWSNKARVLAAVGVGLAVALGAWWLTPGRVTRRPRSLDSYREGERQAREDVQECRADKARLEAQCGGQRGLLGLRAQGVLGEDGIPSKVITPSVTSRPGNTLTSMKALSYRSDTTHTEGGREVVRLAVEQQLQNNGSTPWTPAGAVLLGPRGEEWKALGVWPLEAIAPGKELRVMMEVEVTEEAARGTFTLKLWGQEAGSGGEFFDGVTFP